MKIEKKKKFFCAEVVLGEWQSGVDCAVVIGIMQAVLKDTHADSALVVMWVDLVTCHSAMQSSDGNYNETIM